MYEVIKLYLCEVFMEWVGLESMQSILRNIIVLILYFLQEKKVKFLNEIIGVFVDEYIFFEKVWRFYQK